MAGWKDSSLKGWLCCLGCGRNIVAADALGRGCEKCSQSPPAGYLYPAPSGAPSTLADRLMEGQNLGADPFEVLPHLFFGSMVAAKDLPGLRRRGIRFILNATKELPNYHESEPDLTYYRVPAVDRETEQLSRFFEPSAQFIAAGLATGVLVHCARGQSRSASLVAAYLVLRGQPLDEAVALLCRGRTIDINAGFLQQLRRLEEETTEARLYPPACRT